MSNRDIVLAELSTLKYTKNAGSSIMLRCPFHQDNSPSLGVFIEDGGKIPAGSWHCFGCSERGGWNVLARKLGLARIKNWGNYTEDVSDIVNSKVAQSLLGTEHTSLADMIKDFGDVAAQPWPKTLDWRGYNGRLLNKLGGMLIDDTYNDSLCLVLPVNVQGKTKGMIKAMMTKRKGQLSYVNSKGGWIKTHGMFPYDSVKKMLGKLDLNYVVLVEGPRDALRLITNNIPALAILGAENFGDLKALLISNLPVEYVFVMTDNDAGGDVTWANIKPIMRNYVPTKRLKLPRGKCILDEKGRKIKDKKGNLLRVKTDPGNMSEKILERAILAINNYIETH